MNGRGIFPDDLEQVYDKVTEHKLRQTGLEEASPKLIKDWLEQHQVVSQSFYVSSGVAFSGNNDLRKILHFYDVDCSYMSKTGKYFKTNSYIQMTF